MCETRGWIAVDLDATLAKYDGWKSVEHIGEPIPLMAERVKLWLSEGKDVRIFTARIDGGTVALNMGNEAGKQYQNKEYVRKIIQDWTEKHFGVRLPVTNEKDYGMIECWDDRAVQVIPNTGLRVDEALSQQGKLVEPGCPDCGTPDGGIHGVCCAKQGVVGKLVEGEYRVEYATVASTGLRKIYLNDSNSYCVIDLVADKGSHTANRMESLAALLNSQAKEIATAKARVEELEKQRLAESDRSAADVWLIGEYEAGSKVVMAENAQLRGANEKMRTIIKRRLEESLDCDECGCYAGEDTQHGEDCSIGQALEVSEPQKESKGLNKQPTPEQWDAIGEINTLIEKNAKLKEALGYIKLEAEGVWPSLEKQSRVEDIVARIIVSARQALEVSEPQKESK